MSLRALNGLSNDQVDADPSEGSAASTTVIRPAPALRLPDHAYTGPDAGPGTGVLAAHVRVDVLPRRPRRPPVEVGDLLVHALGWRGHRRRPLDGVGVLGHGGAA